MSLIEQIQKDITDAMRAREELRLSTLRMVKTALKHKEIEKMSALTDQESAQILSTLIKQRKDSMEQFTKGGRPELAEKEAAEIVVIEEFLPKALDEAGLAKLVAETFAELEAALGHKPTVKEMGPAIKAVQAKLQAADVRAEGKAVSELVKKALAG